MTKDIKDYLHLYLGCETDHGTLVGINEGFATVEMSDQTHVGGDIQSLKPILRPLSDMTEEEKKTAHEIYYVDKIELLAIMDVAHFELCRYLLARGFDLYKLIDAGLAIDKTTLKEKV